MKKNFILFFILTIAFSLTACGGDYYFNNNEVNVVTIDKKEFDLSKVGEALDGSSDIIVRFDAPKASYILDNLSSIGSPSAENLTLEMNLSGDADWKRLADLSTVQGLTSLSLRGECTLKDISPILKLSDLETLTVFDNSDLDYTTLSSHPSLKNLYIEAEQYDFPTLQLLPLESIEIPLREDLWLGLESLKNNESLKFINAVEKEQYDVKEYLSPEEIYYYQQFEVAKILTQYRRKCTDTPVPVVNSIPKINGTMVLAAPPNVLQATPYSNQQMMDVYCNADPIDEVPHIYFPYIKQYGEIDSSTSFLTLNATEAMEKHFMRAISMNDCRYIMYIIPLDSNGHYAADVTAGNITIRLQIYDIQNNQLFPATDIYTVTEKIADDPGEIEHYQEVILSSINKYIEALPFEDTLE